MTTRGGGNGGIEGKRIGFIIVKMKSGESISIYEVDPNGTILTDVSDE